MRVPLDQVSSVTEAGERASTLEGAATDIDFGWLRGSCSSSGTGPTAWEEVIAGDRGDRMIQGLPRRPVSTIPRNGFQTRLKVMADLHRTNTVQPESFANLRSRANRAKGVSGGVTW
jgi:hypothetical protein